MTSSFERLAMAVILTSASVWAQEPASSSMDFGINGKVEIELDSMPCDAWGAAVQAGKIIIAGQRYHSNSAAKEFVIVRMNATGRLDTTFNRTGFTNGGVKKGTAFGITTVPDSDDIIAVGTSHESRASSVCVVRLKKDGSLIWKREFPRIGVNCTAPVPFAVAHSGNHISVVGMLTDEINEFSGFVLRLKNDGKIDSSFGNAGVRILTSQDCGGNESGSGLFGVVAVGEEIIGVATVTQSRQWKTSVVRLNKDGAFASFGPEKNGYHLFDFGLDNSEGMAIQSNGTAIHIGAISYSGESEGHSFNEGIVFDPLMPVHATAKEIGIAKLDMTGNFTTFGPDNDGRVSQKLGGTLRARVCIAVAADGTVVGAAQGNEKDRPSFGIVRVKPDGLIDQSFGDQGVQQVQFSGSKAECPSAVEIVNERTIVIGCTEHPSPKIGAATLTSRSRGPALRGRR